GRFPYTRLAADKGQGTRNNPTSEYPVQFLITCDQSRVLLFADILEFSGNRSTFGFFRTLLPASPATSLFLDHFLHIGIPFPTGRTPPYPFGTLRTAVLTEITCPYFSHINALRASHFQSPLLLPAVHQWSPHWPSVRGSPF